MRFPSPDPKKSVAALEEEVLEFWQKEKIFERTVESRHPRNNYVFFDGPPFATGTPHYGHILAGAIKDAIPRYMTMKGYRVERVFGWDCHGVPVEFQVEKEHDIGGKPGIEKMGVDKFNELCRSIVMRCRDDWEATVARMGRFVDFHNDYKTMDPSFMESVWWVFAQLWKKGLIYEGHKVVAYSPKLASPLSNFEAGLNYKDIDDPAVTVRFKLIDEENTYALAWTTTPWTLPENVGLGFGRDTDYIKIEQNGAYYWIAEKAASRYFEEGLEVIERRKGKDFLFKKYEPILPFFDDGTEKRFLCIHDKGDYVSTEEGTGIVHFAPMFGADDAELCAEFDMYGVDAIDENGFFDDTIPELKGRYFRYDPEVEGSKEKNANDWVIEKLKETGTLFHREQIRHSYPHCWRTDCALMYRGVKTWFVDVGKIKDQVIKENKEINWIPEHLRDGRFGKILENAPDWAISRNRYWGCPLPVWRCEECGEIEVMGAKAELEEKVGKNVDDLHKHFVDDLTWKCAKCKGEMKRVPEVLDCWFESGSMPYGSIHYPFQSELNEGSLTRSSQSHSAVAKGGSVSGSPSVEFQSADFIAEGLDQTRGWFYTLHVLGVALFGKHVFKNVITNGIVLAEDGHKMSKSKKNYPDPHLIFDKYGADAMRYYLLSSPVVRGENLRFAEHGVGEVLKSVILALRSTYQFFSTYANVDHWEPTQLIFVRHGDADHNTQHTYSGKVENDHHLTDKGKQEAEAVAEEIPQVDVLYTSPFPRTKETADILLASQKRKDFTEDERIREYEFGDLEGKPYIPIDERIKNKTCESIASVNQRTGEFLEEVMAKHQGQTVAIVSHGGSVRGMKAKLLNIEDQDDYLLMPMTHTGQWDLHFATPQPKHELDQWILAELNNLLKHYREHFDAYDLEGALRPIPGFIDNLNNWYLRLSRKRFWASGMNEEKISGYETLHHVLLTLSNILAPVCPFFAEKLFQDLGGNRSVHLETMPEATDRWADKALEEKMNLSRDIVGLAASIRARKGVKLRQPLAKLRFSTTSDADLDLEIIKHEANVKEVEVLKSLEGIAEQIIKVDAKKVGPRLGAKVQELIKAGKEGNFKIGEDGACEVAGETLAPDEYERAFLTEEGMEAEATSNVVVVLDTEITEELKIEGLARDLIRVIQDLRKEEGFDVADRIKVTYTTDSEDLQKAFHTHQEMIAGEVLAEEITLRKGISGNEKRIEEASVIIDIMRSEK